jgi:hypothetical protein
MGAFEIGVFDQGDRRVVGALNVVDGTDRYGQIGMVA